MKLFRHAIELLAVFATVIAGHDSAGAAGASYNVNEDVDRWSTENGVIVTKEAREQLARNLATAFVSGAPGIGLRFRDLRQLGDVIADGGTVEASSTGKSVRFVGRSSTGEVMVNVQTSDQRQYDLLQNTAGFDKIRSILETYPNIHLLVQPVPPRDYSVKINGHAYPATEKALYGVAPGSVTVTIERAGKPPCEWSGTVSAGQEQTVTCAL